MNPAPPVTRIRCGTSRAPTDPFAPLIEYNADSFTRMDGRTDDALNHSAPQHLSNTAISPTERNRQSELPSIWRAVL